MIVTLPDPGEGLLEAEITRWLVAPGDVVAVNDPLVEIETAKSLVELPSPHAGVVGALLVAEGDLVPVGSAILTVVGPEAAGSASPGGVEGPDAVASALSGGVKGSDAAASASSGGPGASASSGVPQVAPDADAATATLVGYGAVQSSVVRRPRINAADPRGSASETRGPADRSPSRARASESQHVEHPATTPGKAEATASEPQHVEDPATTPSRAAASEPLDSPPATARPQATPVVRRLARDLGVDLAEIAGTGPDGHVTPADVAGAVAGGRRPESTHIPLRGVRRQMVASMAASVETPQASIWLDVDVTRTVDLIETLRSRREFAHLRISPLLVIAKAVCLALARHPEINSTLHLDRDEIVVHPDVNLGIAAATQRGLVVPNVKRAQELSLLDLAEALHDLVSRARAGSITPADCADGTFSITNVGVFGVEGGTPILNPGESAILCLGAINRRPWVVGSGDAERIVPRSVATLSLTIDHRVLDGEQGARFLADVATIIADPGLALLF